MHCEQKVLLQVSQVLGLERRHRHIGQEVISSIADCNVKTILFCKLSNFEFIFILEKNYYNFFDFFFKAYISIRNSVQCLFNSWLLCDIEYILNK